jgi:hypothetical protein
LGNRVSAMVPFINSGDLAVGIQLNPEEALNVVNKGPQANEPVAEEFRKSSASVVWSDLCDRQAVAQCSADRLPFLAR